MEPPMNANAKIPERDGDALDGGVAREERLGEAAATARRRRST
jgi:hypothetical protein